MSRGWLASTLIAAACFVEPPTVTGCPRGEPGCDCDAGSCEAGSECVASIDKCVPDDCTPGTHTCFCTENGACDGVLLCREGVCVNEEMATGTGESAASSVTGSTGPGDSSMSATSTPTTEVSESDPMTSSATSTSDDAGSGETGSGSATSTSSTGGGPMTCEECILQQWSGKTCVIEQGACVGNSACMDIYDCFDVGGPSCCGKDSTAWMGWEDYIMCALAACGMDPAGCDGFSCM